MTVPIRWTLTDNEGDIALRGYEPTGHVEYVIEHIRRSAWDMVEPSPEVIPHFVHAPTGRIGYLQIAPDTKEHTMPPMTQLRLYRTSLTVRAPDYDSSKISGRPDRASVTIAAPAGACATGA